MFAAGKALGISDGCSRLGFSWQELVSFAFCPSEHPLPSVGLHARFAGSAVSLGRMLACVVGMVDFVGSLFPN